MRSLLGAHAALCEVGRVREWCVKGMIHEYHGRQDYERFLGDVTEALDKHGTLSPGGASMLLGVSRQRVYELIQTIPYIEAWAYYDERPSPVKRRQADSLEVSVRGLLTWAVRTGRFNSEEQLTMPWEKIRRVFAEVLQTEGKPDTLVGR